MFRLKKRIIQEFQILNLCFKHNYFLRFYHQNAKQGRRARQAKAPTTPEFEPTADTEATGQTATDARVSAE